MRKITLLATLAAAATLSVPAHAGNAEGRWPARASSITS